MARPSRVAATRSARTARRRTRLTRAMRTRPRLLGSRDLAACLTARPTLDLRRLSLPPRTRCAGASARRSTALTRERPVRVAWTAGPRPAGARRRRPLGSRVTDPPAAGVHPTSTPRPRRGASGASVRVNLARAQASSAVRISSREDVAVAGVAGELLDHVDEDPAHGERAAAVVEGQGVEVVRRGDAAGLLGGGPVGSGHRRDRVVVGQVERLVGVDGAADLLAGAARRARPGTRPARRTWRA